MSSVTDIEVQAQLAAAQVCIGLARAAMRKNDREAATKATRAAIDYLTFIVSQEGKRAA